ncbi:MAG: hypothetical protein ACK44Z_08325, partial [Pirellulaceae bacterium]
MHSPDSPPSHPALWRRRDILAQGLGSLGLISLGLSGCDSRQAVAPTPSAPSGGVATTPSAPSSTSTALKRVVFVVNTDDPFWDACRQGLLEG